MGLGEGSRAADASQWLPSRCEESLRRVSRLQAGTTKGLCWPGHLERPEGCLQPPPAQAVPVACTTCAEQLSGSGLLPSTTLRSALIATSCKGPRGKDLCPFLSQETCPDSRPSTASPSLASPAQLLHSLPCRTQSSCRSDCQQLSWQRKVWLPRLRRWLRGGRVGMGAELQVLHLLAKCPAHALQLAGDGALAAGQQAAGAVPCPQR